MSNMIMASSKTPITTQPKFSPKPKSFSLPAFSLLSNFPTVPKIPTLSLKLNNSLAAIFTASLAAAPPSLAEEIEKAQLFDFDLTLPIMMAQFLLLMVALDKLYYTPLGQFMDARDAEIKGKLTSVKDTAAEVKQLEEQAAAVMRAAKAEVAAALNKMKKETTEEVEEKITTGKAKLEAELLAALEGLEKQKEETKKSLDSQIAALSDEIVKKVLPAA